MAVLKELGRQQEPGDILVAPMWSSLQVLEVTDDNQTLYVTLSKEFLSPPTADESQRAAMCRAAVLSISNTLLGMGEYSQVQILVEMPSTGKVQRPTRGQAGFLGSDENTVLGLLTAQPELILTPWTAAEIAMRAVSNMDSLVLYDILYRSGGKMPDIFAFQSVLQEMPESIKEYEIGGLHPGRGEPGHGIRGHPFFGWSGAGAAGDPGSSDVRAGKRHLEGGVPNL